MNEYHFIPDSVHLNQSSGGQWKAVFEAYVYQDQQFKEIGNHVNAEGIRVIEFDVTGDELPPVHQKGGQSATYTRGSESQVELVLTKDGKRKNVIYTSYP